MSFAILSCRLSYAWRIILHVKLHIICLCMCSGLVVTGDCFRCIECCRGSILLGNQESVPEYCNSRCYVSSKSNHHRGLFPVGGGSSLSSLSSPAHGTKSLFKSLDCYCSHTLPNQSFFACVCVCVCVYLSAHCRLLAVCYKVCIECPASVSMNWLG